MKTSKIMIAALSLTLAQGVPTVGLASQAQQTDLSGDAQSAGGTERIQSAKFLRAMTQEVAAAACVVSNGLATDQGTALMADAMAGFDLHIDALINGNTELGIEGGETRRKTLQQLEAMQAAWAPFSDAAKTLAANPGDAGAADVIKASESKLYAMSEELVGVIETQFSNPTEVIQSNVLTIEIAGRQAMKTLKMAKLACEMHASGVSDAALDELRDTIKVYDTSLYALRNGMPAMGIPAAPTPQIAETLDAVQASWKQAMPVLERAVSGDSLSDEDVAGLFQQMMLESEKLNGVLQDYVEASKF